MLTTGSEHYLVAKVTNPTIDLIGFFNVIASSLQIRQRFESKADFLLYFSDFIEKISRENKRVLVVVDEAHKLSPEHLEEIRLLSNIAGPGMNKITFFFIGQNELNQVVLSDKCAALRQRITLHFQVEPLTENETEQYIRFRLQVAGTAENIFNHAAVSEVYRFAKGNPRLINMICDRALSTAYVDTSRTITPETIRECSRKLLLPGESLSDLLTRVSRQSKAKFKILEIFFSLCKEKFCERLSSFRRSAPALFNFGLKLKTLIAATACIAAFAFLLKGNVTPPEFNEGKPGEKQPVTAAQRATDKEKPTPSPSAAITSNRQKFENGVQQEISPSTNNFAVEKITQPVSLEFVLGLLEKEKFSEAAALLEAAMRSEEGGKADIKTLHARALRGEAGQLIKKDQKQAEQLLLKAVAVDATNYMVYFDLGKLYTAQKEYEKAIDAYTRSIKINPGFPGAYYNFGLIYSVFKNYVRAEEMFMQSAKLQPAYLDKVLFNMAMVQHRQGKIQQCTANLEKALKVNPENKKAKKVLREMEKEAGLP
ncbi:MAG: tetratricopeptide repeat protein [Desulfobulbaceae bacterium]|nr:tetratricopeptide repeat protein [Desulfobulbaceae bacterium]